MLRRRACSARVRGVLGRSCSAELRGMIPRSVFRADGTRMAVYSTNEFSSGMKILLDGDPVRDPRERVRQARQRPSVQSREDSQSENRARRRAHVQVRRHRRRCRRRRSRHAVPLHRRAVLVLHGARHVRADRRRRGGRRRRQAVDEGAGDLHRHVVGRRAAVRRGAESRRAQDRRDGPRACAATPRPAVRSPRSSRPAPSCACRCSSTKAK